MMTRLVLLLVGLPLIGCVPYPYPYPYLYPDYGYPPSLYGYFGRPLIIHPGHGWGDHWGNGLWRHGGGWHR